MSSEEIVFINHYQDLIAKSQQKFLADVLGVMFSAKILEERHEGEYSREEVLIPLSVILNPKITEIAKEHFKGLGKGRPVIEGYQPKENEQIRSMAELSKEDFLNLVRQAGGR